MVFIGGPLQCEKTYLAKELLKSFYHSQKNYFNWDSAEDKKTILSGQWRGDRLVVLDEIHK